MYVFHPLLLCMYSTHCSYVCIPPIALMYVFHPLLLCMYSTHCSYVCIPPIALMYVFHPLLLCMYSTFAVANRINLILSYVPQKWSFWQCSDTPVLQDYLYLRSNCHRKACVRSSTRQIPCRSVKAAKIAVSDSGSQASPEQPSAAWKLCQHVTTLDFRKSFLDLTASMELSILLTAWWWGSSQEYRGGGGAQGQTKPACMLHTQDDKTSSIHNP